MNLQEERADLVEGAIEYIEEHFPALRERLEIGQPWSLGYGTGDGTCSHPELTESMWFAPEGFEHIDLPDGFCFVGLQNGGIRENLVAMWREGNRLFWFHETYVLFVANSKHSIERTRVAVEQALQRWDQGQRRVVYSGSCRGWNDRR